MRDEILESLEWFEVMECPEAFSCIYVWRNKVNGKTYVGKAKKLHERRYGHLRAKDDYYFHNSLRKHGAENYQLAIIVKDVPAEELDDIERYYIKVLNSLNKNGKGYNCSDGGEGGYSCAGKTEEEMKKIRKKQSEALSGENNPFYGKKHSKETKQKLSEGRKGKYKGKYSGENNPQARKVVLLNTGEIFDYIKQAKEKYGINPTGITNCCKRKNNSAGIVNGKPAIWMYYSDYEKLSEEELNKIKNQEVPNVGRSKAVICLNTSVIYESAHEASRATGIVLASISRCCLGKLKSAGVIDGKPAIWMFLEDYEKKSEKEVNKIKNQEVPNGGRPKAVICVTTRKIYESIYEAERETEVAPQSICACCRGKLKSAGKDENGNKLVWMYLDEYLESLK